MSPWDKEISDELGFVHKNNVWWHEAPLPRRWHKCSAWSKGFIRSLGSFGFTVERCACGGTRLDGHNPWTTRNSRRKGG
jgi:hypothetical protein